VDNNIKILEEQSILNTPKEMTTMVNRILKCPILLDPFQTTKSKPAPQRSPSPPLKTPL
jgi:hypothetical protein